jgi:peptide/nickel transport system substrate-binding protein
MMKITRRSFLKAAGLTAAAAAAPGLLAGCGAKSSASADNTVNIGSTGSLSTLNPLMVDATWINMYAAMLQYNPLVVLDDKGTFQGLLADSITTDDNLTYTIHIDDKAKWSDGQPVSAEDLRFTMWALTSSKVANITMMLTALVGTDDSTGYRAEGVDDIEGVKVVDDKTVTFTFKYEMNSNVFQTGYAQYIYPVPAHKLKDVAEDQLASYDWFSAPDVVSGPYICTEKDNDHYVSYKANDAYWRGAPKIPYLNIKIVEGAQLLSGLQSGEIDVVPPLLGTINQDDYDTVLSLQNVTAAYGSRYAVESLFINCNTIPELEIRQALLCGLDRQAIISGLLNGEGDLCDGFAVPAGPYYRDVTPTAFDAAKAKQLVDAAKAAGWDATKTYNLYLNSGEETLVNAATVAQTYWQAAGINVKLNTVDLSTLMTMCSEGSGDLYGVQYTYPPADPSWDIQWVLPSWCFYASDALTENVAKLTAAADDNAYADALKAIDQEVQENVPFIDLYVNGPLGAVSSRVSGAQATMYGCLYNVETWSINA